MDGADATPSQPLQFTPRQLELMEELARLGQKFNYADMFAGALYALHNKTNPEALPQAAHSLRELMEKLEGERNIPITPKKGPDGAGSLGDKTRELRKYWENARTSACYQREKEGWAGELDGPLVTLLVRLDRHFVWFESNVHFVKNKAAATVRSFDPMADLLPPDVQEAQIQEWRGLKDFFQSVGHHHGGVSAEQMEATVAALERFLHSRLAPVIAEDQAALQELIDEVEGHG